MNKVNSHNVGLTVGGMVGIMHGVWALMVLLGLALPFMQWILGLHFVSMQVSIDAFSLVTAIGLVAVTAIIGYVMGYILGELWNLAHRKSHEGK